MNGVEKAVNGVTALGTIIVHIVSTVAIDFQHVLKLGVQQHVNDVIDRGPQFKADPYISILTWIHQGAVGSANGGHCQT